MEQVLSRSILLLICTTVFFPFFTVPPYTTRRRFEAIHSRGANWVTNLPGFAKWTLWYLPMLCFRAHKSWSSVQVLCSCDGCIKTGCRMHYCIGCPWFPIFQLPLPDACGGSSVGHVWWFVAANIPYNNLTSHRSTPAACGTPIQCTIYTYTPDTSFAPPTWCVSTHVQ